jgi:hypothetical protein
LPYVSASMVVSAMELIRIICPVPTGDMLSEKLQPMALQPKSSRVLFFEYHFGMIDEVLCSPNQYPKTV